MLLKTIGAGDKKDEHDRLLKLVGGDPRIELRDREYDAAALATLVRLCDCFVSPHRSEGFGRGPAEAMRLGVPTIVTGYSGNLDFTTDRTAALIDYRLVPVGQGEYPGWQDQVWAEVGIEHLAQLMRSSAERPRAIQQRAAAARKFMADHFGIAAVAQRLDERLASILDQLIPPEKRTVPKPRNLPAIKVPVGLAETLTLLSSG